MHKKTTNLFIILLIVSLVGCSSSTGPESRLHRFIDNLDEPNIILSPLTRFQKDSSESEGIFPPESYPLLDLGSGNNPYGIKRKLKLKGREVNALYCPPKSLISFKMKPR